MWKKEDLQKLVQEKLNNYLFIVVSNREPYVHSFKKGKIECHRGIGGVITALDSVMQACDGLWVAHGNGEADWEVTDPKGKVSVPPENPKYVLKRVKLNKAEEEGYYYGYSNEVLWPLCHMAFERPLFNAQDWEHYRQVNEKFAKVILEEIGNRKAFVWIQDYHFCLLAKYLKEMAPQQVITSHFWHIPWPSYEVFRICPQKKEILEGLLANDLLGFHIRYHCNNFFDVIDREIESKIDRERLCVVKGGHETMVRSFPISVDFEGIGELANTEEVKKIQQSLIEEFDLSGQQVLSGLDRIDYTKGLPDKLRAVDKLFEHHPELCGKVVLLQIGAISRLHIPKYKALNDEINALVEQINWKYATAHWKPIIFVRRQFSLKELLALYRISDTSVISSLHDGMNLVAKEYIASCNDLKGMLVLSQFTGAARELTDAVLVNPYDQEEFADGIYKSLVMSAEERAQRMAKMREIIAESNIYRWSGKVISELLKLKFKEEIPADGTFV